MYKRQNISCTNLLSKVYESFVLEWSRDEVVPKTNQFGGEKGVSTDHFLIRLIDEITSDLEDRRAATILASIDYSKAFNRLAHGSCLEVFAKRGASNEILRLLSTFMRDRKMTVKVGSDRSQLRPVNAGAPQGSVLGCYLFNVGTDDLEEGFDSHQTATQADHVPDSETLPRINSSATSTPDRRGTGLDGAMSPVMRREQEESSFYIELLPRVVNSPGWLRRPKEPHWVGRPVTYNK